MDDCVLARVVVACVVVVVACVVVVVAEDVVDVAEDVVDVAEDVVDAVVVEDAVDAVDAVVEVEDAVDAVDAVVEVEVEVGSGVVVLAQNVFAAFLTNLTLRHVPSTNASSSNGSLTQTDSPKNPIESRQALSRLNVEKTGLSLTR